MYTSQKQPSFTKHAIDAGYFSELRKEVYTVVSNLPKQRHQIAVVKAILLPSIYIALYVFALHSQQFLLFCFAYMCMGWMLVILFLNLIHEASHDTLFQRKKANRMYLLLFDLMGANSYMWKKRHRLHHHFTNVNGWDSDIEKSKFLKVHPQDSTKRFVRYQHLLVFLYPLFITNWFLIRDFKDFFSNKPLVRKHGAIPLQEYLKLFFFKLFFVGYVFVFPVMATPFNWTQILMAFFLLLLSAGFFALAVLLPPHVNTSNQFPSVNSHMQLQQSWFQHQFITTNDVIADNWITRHVMANFNYHIAHHLFPNISYVYAKEVTAVIKQFSLQKGLPYRSYPLATTLINHYRLIKQNRQVPDIWNEDM